MTNEKRRVAVVTGASSGIGREAAKALAAAGWRVIGVGRDPERTADAATEIAGVSNGGSVDMLRADLSLIRDAARLADDIAALTDRIDVLVNNAGGTASEEVITDEGHEHSFASNHLGPFLLTNRLLPLLRAAAAQAPEGSVRIVNVSSIASEYVDVMPWDAGQPAEPFNAGKAYCQGKLANVLFARGLSKRLAADGIVAHAMHPGTVTSNFTSYADAATQAYIATLDSISPVEGADTIVWLATANEPGRSNGGYFFERLPRTPNPLVEDEAAVEKLWSESERLTGYATL